MPRHQVRALAAAIALILASPAWAQVCDSGTIIVDGDDTGDQPSPWNPGNRLTIARDGECQLVIRNGGEVTTPWNLGAMEVGANAGSNGTVTVTGDGSRLWLQTGLRVGIRGTGTVVVEEGGLVELTNDGSLYLGEYGEGTLTVRSGGQVKSRGGILGVYEGSTGTAVVSGEGSAWNLDTGISIGGNYGGTGPGGTGSLTIEDGGAVTAGGRIAIGSAGAVGTVTVTGAQSELSGGNLFVGSGPDGEGELVISDGATVTSDRGHVGYPGATGRVTVTGGATWTLRDMLTLGTQGGSGDLLISDGGIVRMAESNYIKSISVGDSDGTGRMEVTGDGSLFSFDGTFYIARSDTSEGEVLVADGGRIESGAVGIGGYYDGTLGKATATVTGTGSTWVSTDGISLRQRGALTISAGGQVRSAHAQIGVGSTEGEVAVATVTGAGSSWTTAGGFVVGRVGAGTLVVSNGGTMRAGENGEHTVEIARGPDAIGRLYIGGGEGEAPSEATVDIGRIVFGAGDGMLVFNHSGAGVEIDSAISGEGVIEHRAGTTTFSGVSDTGTRFRGVTRVTGGSLAVDGVFGDASHVMEVSNGATLGGTGTIIGNVTIGDASLAAGASPGTLTVDGNLALGADSVLDFELGAPDGAPGVDSDLVVVTGDLVLDGTLDVTDAGGFGEGLYRLFDYGGALADNGLEIGMAPTGFDAGNLTVQTSVANQVNLLVGMPIGASPFSFWDGSDTTANGSIDGDTGTWTAAGSNWTLADGTANGAYDPTAMLIFAGAPGEVTVDASEGPVVASGGLQFAVDGYTVVGDELRLDGTAVVRVGDGTAAGAGMTATIAANVSGDAGLVKTDLGTLVLAGTNSYFGGTTIDAGTLEIRSDAALGDADGGVTLAGTAPGGATLAFGAALSSARAFSVAGSDNALLLEDGTVELSGRFSGAGELAKRGPGLLHFTGDGTDFTGRFLLDEGGMRFDGVLASSVFTAAGTVLRGIGEIGNLVVAGRLEPGASIGTLTVAGDLTLASGSVYEVELRDAGNVAGVDNDLVRAGTATLESGVTLHVTPENGTDTGTSYVPGTVYTIIETAAAGNLVVDAAPTITDDFAFLDFTGESDGWNYYLTSRRIASFCREGMSFNQCSTANAVEDLGAGHPAFDAALLLGDAEANGAFDALSGEIHASGQLAVERSFALFNRALRHQGVLAAGAGDLDADARGAWVAALGGDGRIDGDGNAARMDTWNAGVAAGYERAIETESGAAVGGFGVGYLRSHAAVDDRRSSFDGDGVHLGAYGAWTGGAWSLAGAVAYATERVSTERLIAFGTVEEAAAADYRVQTIGLSGEAGYAFQLGSATRLGPLFTLDASWSSHDGFSESGAGAFDLASGSQSWKRIDAGVGLELTHVVQGAHGDIALEGRIVWEHAFGDEVPRTANRFGSAAGFEIRGPVIDANRPRIGAGLSWAVSESVDIRARYDGLPGGDEANHSAWMAVHFRF